MTDNHQFLYSFFLLYLFPIALMFLIVWGALSYTSFLPSSNETTISTAFLTGASILFGFVTSSLIRFSDRVVDLKQRASDVAKEFCEEYDVVKSDKKLSSIDLSFNTWIEFYGGRKSAFGCTEKAPITIKEAYHFLSSIFRWWVNIYKNIIYLLHLTALIALGASIILSLLSFAPVLAEATIKWAVMTFMLSIPIIVFGWLISSKLLNDLDDTLFNVRQQIIGGIADILPEDYKTHHNY
jgi:hypothetical protein